MFLVIKNKNKHKFVRLCRKYAFIAEILKIISMIIYSKFHEISAINFSMLKLGTNIYSNNNRSPTYYYKNNGVWEFKKIFLKGIFISITVLEKNLKTI